MSELSEMTTFWSDVKGFVRRVVGGVFSEEEVVDVGPGSATVRPYGEEGTQSLRTLAGAVIRPGDRVVVMRLPALKLVLGAVTTRGVASPLPLPYGGQGGRYGTEDAVARADHHHGMSMRPGNWYGPASHGMGAGSTGTHTLTALRHYAMPFFVPEPMPVTDIAVEVMTAVAGSTAQVAIYDDTGAYRPRNRLVLLPTVDTSTTGVKRTEGTTTLVTLDPGWHWVTLVASHAITVRSAVAARWLLGGANSIPLASAATAHAERGSLDSPDPFGPSGNVLSPNYPLLAVRRAGS